MRRDCSFFFLKMTKKDFNKAQKILKKHFPYYEFELSEEGRIYQPGVFGSDTDFVEISVDSLFALVLNPSKEA